MSSHAARAHSKYSASGSERWMACPGSVALSEGVEDKSTPWAEEGTRAHEMLETQLRALPYGGINWSHNLEPEMVNHVSRSADSIFDLYKSLQGSELLVESRVYLDFIHPEMFGTYDAAIVDHFSTLHVFDFKYGKGVAVSPFENMQMAFYGVGLAHKFDYNFSSIKLWIIQPRIRGYIGPVYWELTPQELLSYESKLKEGVDRVEKNPDVYEEGPHCHWCKAKNICPLKFDGKNKKAANIFSVPLK